MKYATRGTTMPALELRLDPGEAVYSETGGMAWMDATIDISTGTRGGLGGMINRAFAGESLFLTTYTSRQASSLLAFTARVPGQIIPVQLADGQSVIAQRDAFLCATTSTKLEVHLRRRLGSGFFGGEGFVLQKLTGPGLAFIEVGGEVVEYTLQQGEQIRVNPGHIAIYDASVDNDIHVVKGVRNILFGGEGLILATLKGPGKVWLQTMPLLNLMGVIVEHLPDEIKNPPTPPSDKK